MNDCVIIESLTERDAHQVQVQVDEGPGDASHAVEPEAGEGREVPHRYLSRVVNVANSIIVHPHEELDEDLKLARTPKKK